MGVLSDGSYGIDEGIFYSLPVKVVAGEIEIVKGLSVTDFSRRMMDKTKDELIAESKQATELIGF